MTQMNADSDRKEELQNSVNWHFSVQSHRKLNSFFFGEMQAESTLGTVRHFWIRSVDLLQELLDEFAHLGRIIDRRQEVGFHLVGIFDQHSIALRQVAE